jgi:hypothetical protein
VSDDLSLWVKLFVSYYFGAVTLWIVIYSAVRNAIDHERDKR